MNKIDLANVAKSRTSAEATRDTKAKMRKDFSMKREFLEELGITDKETINKILDENSSDIGKVKSGSDEVQSELEELKKKHEALTAANSTLKQSIEESKTRQSTKDEEFQTLQKELEGYKTKALKSQIALDMGIPYQLADRLTGDDEEALKKDAENLAAYLKDQSSTVPPLKSTEPAGINADSGDAAYKKLLEDLNLEGE